MVSQLCLLAGVCGAVDQGKKVLFSPPLPLWMCSTSLMNSERVKILVADSGGFIKGAPLQNWSSKVVTVKEVVEEIRDEATRRMLQVLPYELSLVTPTQPALQHGM